MKSLQSCRINVMVSNMDAAIDFYQDVLGLFLLDRFGDHYAEIKTPDLLLGLHPASKDTVYGNNMSIGFGVTSFDETVQALKSHGIDFRIEQDGWNRLAHFTDPDNNSLFIAERKD